MSEIIRTALIYSCIAFSIVFVVLGGLTAVIYAMRVITGSSRTPSAPASGGGSVPVPAPVPAPVVSSNAAPAAAVAVNVKARHVAVITAAVLAATQGRGRVSNIAPAQVQERGYFAQATRWRSAGIVENVGNHLTPAWKR
jgi:Na+-transporting methylmalonyl-CoA/oxaloacetate decarboxylase gamma subunit